MNLVARLLHSVTGNKAALQKQLDQELENKLSKSNFQRDTSGNVIIDRKAMQRLQKDHWQNSSFVGLMVSSNFVLVSVLLCVLLCYAVMTTYHQAELLRQDGLTTTGVVDQRSTSSGRRNSINYWVTYHFNANGQTFTHIAAVDQNTFYFLNLQGPVPIIYVRSDPSISFVTCKTPEKDLPLIITLTCFWLLGTAVVVYGCLSPLIKQQKL